MPFKVYSDRLTKFQQAKDEYDNDKLFNSRFIGSMAALISDEIWDKALEYAKEFSVKTYPVNVGPNSCKDTNLEVENE